MGLRALRSETGKFSIGFALLDEAVADLIGEEVYVEYLKRAGNRFRYTSRKGNATYPRGYLSGRKCVATLVQRVSQAAGLPGAIVWDTLKQGYYKKSDTTLADLRLLLGEVLNKMIVRMLERVDPRDSEGVRSLLSQLTPNEEDVDKLVGPLVELQNSNADTKKVKQ